MFGSQSNSDLDATYAEILCSHSHRAFYFAVALAKTHFPQFKYDLEGLYLACLWHDIGCTPKNIQATKMSFEFYGGMLAHDWLKTHGATQDTSEGVAETVRQLGAFVAKIDQVLLPDLSTHRFCQGQYIHSRPDDSTGYLDG